MIRIPSSELQAIALFTADKNEVRYYMRGVHITSNQIQATNGHIVGRLSYPISGGEEIPEKGILIDGKAIADLFRGMTAKEKRDSIVSITTEPGDFIKLECEERAVISNLDFNQFPDIDRVIPADEQFTGEAFNVVRLNWEYMALFQKVADILKKKKRSKTVFTDVDLHLNSNPEGVARVLIPGAETFNGVIMPMRRETGE